MGCDNDRYPFSTGPTDLDTGSARDSDRQVLIRLDGHAYSILWGLAAREGVAPTTMARMLLRGMLAQAASRDALGPLP